MAELCLIHGRNLTMAGICLIHGRTLPNSWQKSHNGRNLPTAQSVVFMPWLYDDLLVSFCFITLQRHLCFQKFINQLLFFFKITCQQLGSVCLKVIFGVFQGASLVDASSCCMSPSSCNKALLNDWQVFSFC